MELTDVHDEHFFRRVLGRYPTGVVAVTSLDSDGEPLGMIVGSFSSVSLEPRLVSFMAAKTSSSYARQRTRDRFCVNVLSDRQEDVCRALAVKKGVDKFAGVTWRPSPLGSPVIDGVVAWIDCVVVDEIEAGDHYIVLGRVVDLEVAGPGLPLIFHNGGYGSFIPRSRVIPARPDLMAHVVLADLARRVVEPLTRELEMECAIMTTIGEHVVRVAGVGAPPVGAAPIQVGQRMPFWAPLGALMVAWRERRTQEEWARRGAGGGDPAAVEAHLAALDRVRERGWVVSLGTDAYRALDDVLAHQPDGPARDARVRELEAALGGPRAYYPESLTGEGSYRVRNVSAPVFGPGGQVVLYLSLFGFPEACAGSDVVALAERLRACAGEIGELVPR
ncbi:flavin reductase [Nonomuraea sp. NPDC050394]|uniref:flavin reductase n=1 Tax=Nonomuraea sp. NPDC050394 TaxID=3364363 RepID=UPI00378786C1